MQIAKLESLDLSSRKLVFQGLLTMVQDVSRATIVALQMNRPALVRARAMWIKLGEHPPELD